jgi:hypothetical protein
MESELKTASRGRVRPTDCSLSEQKMRKTESSKSKRLVDFVFEIPTISSNARKSGCLASSLGVSTACHANVTKRHVWICYRLWLPTSLVLMRSTISFTSQKLKALTRFILECQTFTLLSPYLWCARDRLVFWTCTSEMACAATFKTAVRGMKELLRKSR